MTFEFDPGKNELNRSKHDFSFEDAQRLWNVPGVEANLGIVHSEFRYLRLAELAGIVYLAVFTYRAGPAIRLISARKATAKEAQTYEQNRKK